VTGCYKSQKPTNLATLKTFSFTNQRVALRSVYRWLAYVKLAIFIKIHFNFIIILPLWKMTSCAAIAPTVRQAESPEAGVLQPEPEHVQAIVRYMT